MDEIKYKICSCCKIVKVVSEFHTNNATKDRLGRYCKECIQVKGKLQRERCHEQRVEKSAKYYRENREHVLKRVAKYRKDNKEKVQKSTAKWQKENSEKCLCNGARYKRNHKERVLEANRIYKKKRGENDPSFKLKVCLSSRLNSAFKAQGTVKSNRTTILIGCSIQELKLHLESQFQPGMSWENRGKQGWEVDHIKPCAAFDLTKEEEQYKCFHYSNLQPLWRRDNSRKSSLYKGKRYVKGYEVKC